MASKRAAKVQIEKLISFLMENRAMVKGNRMDPAVQKLWSEITQQLNAYGIQKSCREWMETYKLMSRKAKMKARRTGSGNGVDKRLNAIEKKIILIEGPVSVYRIQQRQAGVTRVEKFPENQESPSTSTFITNTPSPPVPPIYYDVMFETSTSASITHSPSPPSPPIDTFQTPTFAQSVPSTQSKKKLNRPVHHDDFEESLRKSTDNLCQAINTHGDKILQGMTLISEALLAIAKKNN